MSERPNLELVAAALRADAGDLRVFFQALASKLDQAFPGRCRVRRAGLLGKGPVREIAVEVGDARYQAESRNGSVTARRSSIVRGITLKNDELGLDEWIDALARDVLAESERSERGRLALENLLIGTHEEAT